MLGLHPAKLEMAELRVGDECPAIHEGAPDPGSEGEHQDQTVGILAGPIPVLGQTGSVGVVQQRDG